MAGFHGVVNKVLVIEGLLEVPIYACEVEVWDFSYVIQLAADTTG